MLIATLSAFSILILTTTGSPSSRIVGGTPSNTTVFPFIAQVQVTGSHQCAGYIYNSKWIVTAASCVFGKRISDLKVVVGQSSLTSTDPNEKSYNILNYIYHPSYDAFSKKNNIAMLELSGSITFGVNSNYIVHGDLPQTTTVGTLVGWGGTYPGSISSSLRYAEVPITNDGTCSVISDNNQWDPNLMICAGGDDKFACTGDGGGPLVIGTSTFDYVIVGILSHISSCNDPAAFTRLPSYTSWMIEIGGSIPTTTPLTTVTSSDTTPLTTVTSSDTTPLTTVTSSNTVETSISSTLSTLSTTISENPTTSTTVSNTQTCLLAEVGQYPYIVSIGDRFGRHYCSGFIYNKNFIITTTTCVSAYETVELFITLGVIRPSAVSPAEKISVKAIILNSQDDIALIEVETLTFNDNVNRIIIEEADYTQPSSTVVGWASTEANGCINSLDLLWDTKKITANNNCNGIIANFNPTTMICVETNNNFRAPVGSCHFESGAPLVQKLFPVVIGIKSSVEGSCAAESFTVYTRLSTLIPWINENTQLKI